jgi:hypothetical protein
VRSVDTEGPPVHMVGLQVDRAEVVGNRNSFSLLINVVETRKPSCFVVIITHRRNGNLEGYIILRFFCKHLLSCHATSCGVRTQLGFAFR